MRRDEIVSAAHDVLGTKEDLLFTQIGDCALSPSVYKDDIAKKDYFSTTKYPDMLKINFPVRGVYVSGVLVDVGGCWYTSMRPDFMRSYLEYWYPHCRSGHASLVHIGGDPWSESITAPVTQKEAIPLMACLNLCEVPVVCYVGKHDRMQITCVGAELKVEVSNGKPGQEMVYKCNLLEDMTFKYPLFDLLKVAKKSIPIEYSFITPPEAAGLFDYIGELKPEGGIDKVKIKYYSYKGKSIIVHSDKFVMLSGGCQTIGEEPDTRTVGELIDMYLALSKEPDYSKALAELFQREGIIDTVKYVLSDAVDKLEKAAN